MRWSFSNRQSSSTQLTTSTSLEGRQRQFKFKVLPSSWRWRNIPNLNASFFNLMLNFRAIGFKRTCLRPILILPAALPCLDSELEQHHCLELGSLRLSEVLSIWEPSRRGLQRCHFLDSSKFSITSLLMKFMPFSRPSLVCGLFFKSSQLWNTVCN